ncbi:GAF domain-containing protein [Archangium gephyra]|nr:GAF domain-containing protein [Archangium gephyra]
MLAHEMEWDVAGERVEPEPLLTRLQQSERTLLQLSEALGEGEPVPMVSALRREAESLQGLRSQLESLLGSWALVAELSHRLLNLPLEEMEPGLRATLAVLGEWFGSQRAYVFLLSEDRRRLSEVYEWCAEGVAPHDVDGARSVPVEAMSWSLRQLLAGRTVLVKDTALLPPEAVAERRLCEMLGTRSYVHMPLFLGGRLLGWLGCDAVGRPGAWPEESLRLMAVSGGVLVNALQRQRVAASNVRLSESLEQLQEAQSQLLFADRLATIGQLAAGVVHEINNPLSFLLNNLALVKRGMGQSRPPEVTQALADVNEGAERVRLIVQDLKLLSSPDEMERGPVEVGKVVRSAVKLAAHEIRNRAHVVESLDEVPRVRGSEARLCQVFLNLLLNAAHAISPGQPEHNRIQVSAREVSGERVLVEVSDTGCGIPPELLERVFDPFFTTKPVGVGSGLGLSVCRRIIGAHGGELTVESEPGRGTTFQVFLPVHTGDH